MPSVPRASAPRVQQSIGPTVAQQSSVDAESLGFGDSYRQMTSTMIGVVAKAKNDADQIAAMEAKTQLGAYQNDLLYNPETGAFAKKGKNAFSTPTEVNEQYAKRYSEIEAGLTSDRQKQMLRQYYGDSLNDINRQVNRHVSVEMEKYDNATTTANVETERSMALTNPYDTLGIAKSIEKQKLAIDQYAERNGIPPEQRTQMLTEVQSKTNLGVLTRMVDENNDIAAKQYLELARGGMAGDDLIRAEKLVKNSVIEGEGQRLADDFTKRRMSYTQANEELMKIEDPDLRKAATQSYRQNKANEEAARRDQEERLDRSIADQIDAGKKWADIPQSQKSALSSSQRSRLESYAADRSKGKQPSTDWGVWTELQQMASDPSTRDKFNNLNPVNYRPYLSDSQYMDFVQKQVGTRSGSDKVYKDLDGVRSDNQIIDQTAAGVGIVYDKNSKGKAEAYNLYRQAVDVEYQKFVQDNGRKPKNEEMQSIVDQVLIKEKSTGWFSFSRRRFEVPANEQFVSSVESVEDIPQSIRAEIRASKAYLKNPTTATEILLFRKMADNGK